ncbi:MAG: hypothetical protein JEZ09_19920 [Salinivirgaceae bacterium]|nr:hypothetical protein [Salinivirgaceae bacterium]
MKHTLFVIFAIISSASIGQDFLYKADVISPSESGFYKIQLTPEITSKLNNQFYDIRLYDENNTEIPYIFYSESKRMEQDLFVEYEIIKKEHQKRQKYTRIVIQNRQKTEINNMVLRIKNADVQKRLKLNASDDQKNWYVLKNDYYYNSITNSQNTSEIRVLNFPLSNYEYYELLIDDYYDKPINIIQAGYYNTISEYGKYSPLNDINYVINDTLKKTTITVNTQGNYIDKISFEIDAPRYYLRQANVFVERQENLKKRTNSYVEHLYNFSLISNSSNSFVFDNLNEELFKIKIENNDDVPLNIQNLHFYQLNKYISAELKEGKKYHLCFSNTKAVRPNYDLNYFTDSIPDQLETLSLSKPETIIKTKAENKGNLNFKSYWLWISILFVAILLSYMSFKMIKDNHGKDE